MNVLAASAVPLGRLKCLYPGVAFCAVLALAGSFLAEHYGAPALLLVLLLGFGFSAQSRDQRLEEGVAFSARTILRVGIALLGARIGLTQFEEVGTLPGVVVLLAVPLTLGFGLLLGSWLRLPFVHSLVAAVAVAICGVSAAVAVAAALPSGKLEERRLLGVVIGVTALGTLSMVVYPLLTAALGFSAAESGILLGASIHDVAQAAAAGYLVSDPAGDIATLTKLLRVAMLAPLVLLIGYLLRRGEPGRAEFPWFLLGFVVLLALNSFGLIPQSLRQLMVAASSWCLLVTMAALGMRTSVIELMGLGWRPLAQLTLLSVFLVSVVALLLVLVPALT
ncbi:YeiH family protein [Hydrocarboniclastica marina]|uniref:Putative sulfate exporter family transporter n=1 Tax=Hydrocarboniclastica marina TaxID=2259620 RepID=A0A4P7XHM9_9ALTE|nr:putative sulfate exporter family transporter [Hydrocarboniclastica marina]MAL99217.1 putative sulfate exporter family transporter [Alteromonadaceae bacterium]QCF25964.1 putative sulfate exporter family transporter [Hydrocarboniclastica marina]